MKYRIPTRSAKGFTLIEILVVVAIIGLLAAILFPVFASAQEKSRASSCSSNLKQIGLAVHMYIQDNDQRFLRNDQTVTGCPEASLLAYTKSTQVWVCPSETNSTAIKNQDARYVSYDLNNQLAIKTESLFTRPTEIVMTHDSDAGELGWTEGNSWDGGLTTDWPQQRPGGCTESNLNKVVKPCGMNSYQNEEFLRHNGMFNALYVDGHVKLGRPEQFKDTNFIP